MPRYGFDELALDFDDLVQVGHSHAQLAGGDRDNPQHGMHSSRTFATATTLEEARRLLIARHGEPDLVESSFVWRSVEERQTVVQSSRSTDTIHLTDDPGDHLQVDHTQVPGGTRAFVTLASMVLASSPVIDPTADARSAALGDDEEIDGPPGQSGDGKRPGSWWRRLLGRR